MSAVRPGENLPNRFALPFRDGQRRSISWKALLWIGEDNHNCLVTDLSLGGAKIRLDVNVQPDTDIKIEIHDLCDFDGVVAWHEDCEVGIRFTTKPEKVRASLGAIARRLELDAGIDEGEEE